jgi:hypothetical protein
VTAATPVDPCAGPRRTGPVGSRGFLLVRWARGLAATLAALALTAALADDTRPVWTQLTPAQQQALAPLEWKWSTIDAARKQKWLELAARFPTLPADERERVRQRMTAWAALSPADRARARSQFEETRQISPAERQARWERYQSLPDEERQRLARVAPPAPATPAPATAVKPSSATVSKPSGPTKSNLVPVPVAAPAPRPAAPIALQAKPGATTVPVGTRPVPPAHHQAGLPKIVATPSFVDPTTLLPRRGPQGAAMRAEASIDPTRQP